eukprot:8912360-Alexandrium_andersonii.AAC.1
MNSQHAQHLSASQQIAWLSVGNDVSQVQGRQQLKSCRGFGVAAASSNHTMVVPLVAEGALSICSSCLLSFGKLMQAFRPLVADALTFRPA